jgi:hypothetical protein
MPIRVGTRIKIQNRVIYAIFYSRGVLPDLPHGTQEAKKLLYCDAFGDAQVVQ